MGQAINHSFVWVVSIRKVVKILKQNEKYAIVDNYKSDELKKLGYTAEEIEDRKTIGLYDEILKNAK